MQNRAILGALSLLLVVVVPSAAQAQSGDAAVRAAFEDYRGALEARDGSRAAGRVTASTVDFYERCRRAALTMPRAELEEQDFIFRYTTLSLRVELTAARLSAMTGQDVFERAVNEGQVGSGISRMQIQRVRVDGDEAELRLGHGSGPSAPIQLRRESRRWRVDIAQLIALTAPVMARMASSMGDTDENAGLTALLGVTLGRSVDDTVWEPLVPSDA